MDRHLRAIRHIGVAACLLFALAFASGAAAGSGVYLRASLGWGWSGDTRFADENCAQKQPPALFGCGAGNDGRPIGARGDFGNGFAFDLAVGHRFLPWLRAEVLLNYRPHLDFEGNANFLGVNGEQSVSGSAESLAAFAVAWADLPPLGRWRPYLGLGAGVARNRIGPMSYGFPGLGKGALTRTGGGTETGFAWFASVGVALALTDRMSLDVAWRYADLGKIGTASGPATVVRTSGSRTIEVGSTWARLSTQGVLVGLRYRF